MQSVYQILRAFEYDSFGQFFDRILQFRAYIALPCGVYYRRFIGWEGNTLERRQYFIEHRLRVHTFLINTSALNACE
jgi:hypothetical protein